MQVILRASALHGLSDCGQDSAAAVGGRDGTGWGEDAILRGRLGAFLGRVDGVVDVIFWWCALGGCGVGVLPRATTTVERRRVVALFRMNRDEGGALSKVLQVDCKEAH